MVPDVEWTHTICRSGEVVSEGPRLNSTKVQKEQQQQKRVDKRTCKNYKNKLSPYKLVRSFLCAFKKIRSVGLVTAKGSIGMVGTSLFIIRDFEFKS